LLVELPLPIEPEPEEPVLGDVVLGDVVLGEVVLGEVLEEPLELPLMPEELLVPPLEELEPDLLKWASHSEREIWPSLFVSTDEKLGVEALLELELGEVVLDDVPPADDGEDEELLPVAEGDEEEPLVDLSESAAAAASDRAKSAAAVVTVTDLIIEDSLGVGEAPLSSQAACRPREGKLPTCDFSCFLRWRQLPRPGRRRRGRRKGCLKPSAPTIAS
jgi:hypothetical protein